MTKIVMVIHDNEVYRTFACDFQVLGDDLYISSSSSSSSIADISGRELPEDIKALYRKLITLNGVEEVSIRKFEVSIKLGIAFEWEPVIREFKELLQEHDIREGQTLEFIEKDERTSDEERAARRRSMAEY